MQDELGVVTRIHGSVCTRKQVRDLLSKDPKNRLELKESADSGMHVKECMKSFCKSQFLHNPSTDS